MGRATIVSNEGDGLYTVEVDLGAERVDLRLQQLEKQIDGLDVRIADAQANVAEAEAEEVPLRSALSDAIDALATATDKEAAYRVISEATADLLQAQRNTIYARRKLAAIQFDRVAAQKEHDQVQAVTTSLTQQAWCADLTDAASGQVATIEIPGEPTYLLVAPGTPVASRTSIAPIAADGQLLARGAMTGPQAYLNAALLPGWQKFMPDYRAGVISNIDTEANTATVTLFDTKSSAQSLSVNQASVLTDVPVVYMECDAAAFEDGDEVVVQFLDRDWALPRVIGFLTNPRGCWRLAFLFNQDRLVRGYPADIQPAGFDWQGRTIRCLIIGDDFVPAWEWNDDYTANGLLNFSYSPCNSLGVGFQNYDAWNEDPDNATANALTNHLTGVTQIACAFVDIGNVLSGTNNRGISFDFVYDRGPNSTPGKMWIELIFLGGSNQSIFRVFSYPPSPYPTGNTTEQKLFTFPARSQSNYGTYRRYVARVIFNEGSQALWIDGAKVAETTQSLDADWHQFGSVAIGPLTPDFSVSVLPDYWAAK